MLFCAYCGKSFTRKEHLERHIPSHTHVKPHRCGSCQLSFSRRDLLQRHHSTYHEVRDPTQPPGNAVPTLAGRTPIACVNCARAKTGCDKTVPCSRCAEKNLPCAARFARRASKILRRVASTHNPGAEIQLDAHDHASPVQDSSEHKHKHTQICDQPGSVPRQSPPYENDYNFHDKRASMAADTSMSAALMDCNNFMAYGTDFIDPELQYQDYLPWNEFPIDPTMYNGNLVTPEFGDITFSDLGDNSSGSESGSGSSYPCISISHTNSRTHTRNTSLTSIAEMSSPPLVDRAATSQLQKALIAAEASWPLARCHPPQFSSSCPRTALLHLENLEHNSGGEEAWARPEMFVGHPSNVSPMLGQTRDRIIAITQGVLHKALSIHRNGSVDSRSSSSPALPASMSYLALPPTNCLQVLLQHYMRGLAQQPSSVAGGVLDTNDLILRGQASTLLVLLMVAEGAVATGSEEARSLAAGLTEICRISLFDMIEKDVELSADPTILHCAVLFANLGAWGGDKWHMDIVMGQRAMYLAMLKHSGALEAQPPSLPGAASFPAPELQWRAWLQLEGANRLVYNWVLTDLELSFFHDTAPVLQITDLQARLPNNDQLWLCKSIDEWTSCWRELRSSTANSSGSAVLAQLPPSLFELFQDFLQNSLHEGQLPSMLQLKLLLHPLHSLLHHARQALSCFTDILSPSSRDNRALSKESTMARLEEIQALLTRWHELYLKRAQMVAPSALAQTTLVLFHLLSLNVVTSFSEIEKLARKDGFDGSYWDLSLRHKRCIQHSTEAIFHSGQVMRIVKATAQADRPPWWPVAIYRVTLILWVDCLARADPSFPQQQAHGPAVAIDDALPDDPLLHSWRWNDSGAPVLLRKAGNFTRIDDPSEVLSHGIELLDEGSTARMTDGIRRKLLQLHNCWHFSGPNPVVPT